MADPLGVHQRGRKRRKGFVDAANRTLEVLKLDGSVYREIEVFQGDARVRAAPFEEVELNLARWWYTKAGGKRR